jgi:tetratricopeptide (TPR) repeat protein
MVVRGAGGALLLSGWLLLGPAPVIAAGPSSDAFLSASDIADLVAEGRKKLSVGDPAGAIKEFEEAYARDPENPQILYFLGNLYIQLDQRELGLKYLARAVELVPGNYRVRLVLAKAYEHYGELDNARREYQQVINSAPGTREAREAEERNRALAEQERVVEAAPAVSHADVEALIAEGRRLIADKNPEAALILLRSALIHEPQNTELLELAGDLSLDMGKPVPGIKYLERAAELAPDDYRLQMKLGGVYEKYDVLGGAVKLYRDLAARAPATPEGAEAARRAPALLKEVMARREADMDRSRSVEDLLVEGRRLLGEQNAEGALKVFKAVLAEQSTNLEVLYYVGNLLQRLDKPVLGIKYLELSRTLNPNAYLTRWVLGQAYERYDAIESAIEEYQQVISLAPDADESRQASERLLALNGRMKILGDDALILAANFPTLIAQGKRLAAQGDAEGALRMFRGVLTRDPNNEEVILLAARLYSQLGRPAEGLPYIARAVEIQPDNHSMRLLLALTYEQNGLMGDAMQQYQQVVERAPGSSEAAQADKRYRLLNARKSLAEGKSEPAIEGFVAVLSAHPDDVDAFGEAVNALSQADRVSDIQVMLGKVIARVPDRLLPYVISADAYADVADFSGAIGRYEEALRLVPPDSEQARGINLNLLSARGREALQKEAFAEARDRFEELLKLDPENRAAELDLATAFHGLKQMDRAETILTGMTARQPFDMDARLRLAVLYGELGRNDEAAREFEEIKIRARGTPLARRADQELSKLYTGEGGGDLKKRVQDAMVKDWREQLKETPDDAQAWAQFALLSMQLARRDDAIEALENVIRLRPDNNQLKETLASLYEEAGKPEKTEALYRELLTTQQSPEASARLEARLGLLSSKRAFNEGDLTAAEQGFKKLLEHDPDDVQAHFYLAIIYGEREYFERAAHEYQEVLRVVPNHSIAHLSLGTMYEQLNREEDALSEYRTAVQMAPTDSLRESGERRLAALQKRFNGTTFSLNYSTAYNSNNNLTKTDTVAEYRTDLSASINYRHKLSPHPVYIGLVFSPSYSIYHNNRFDLFNTSFTPYATFSWKDIDFSATVTASKLDNFGTDQALNENYSFNGDVAGKFRLPALIPWLADKSHRAEAPGNWRVTYSAREFKSATAPILDARTFSLGPTFDQNIGNGYRWSAGYTLTANENSNGLGTDLAYRSHTVSLRMNKLVGSSLYVGAGYGFTLTNYSNPDSATLFTKFRKNRTHNVFMSFDYFLNQTVRLYANLGWQMNRSNLPTGFILSPEDVGTAVGIQSSSLGDYDNLSLTSGVAFNF